MLQPASVRKCTQVYAKCEGKCFLLDCQREFNDKIPTDDTWTMARASSQYSSISATDNPEDIILLCAEHNRITGEES